VNDAEPETAALVIKSRLDGFLPSVALVLGSGLGALGERLDRPTEISYDEIPGFPTPTVVGHRGLLIAGRLGGVPVLVQSGRFHLYEGHSAAVAARPIRAFAALGIRTAIFTNAAGGIRPGFGPGTLMLIADHLNLTGRTPLEGPVRPGEIRFPDLTMAYDPELRALARSEATRLELPLEEGVYAGLLGPSYETPAEIRMLGRLGADAVGMSTVIEVIAARALGIRCLGLSTITNAAAGLSATPPSHLEVTTVAGQLAGRVGRLIEAIVTRLGQSSGAIDAQ
jgi:purine-nucleoside phosphorylase